MRPTILLLFFFFVTESLQSHSMLTYSKQKILLQSGALMPKTPTLGNTLVGPVAGVHSAEWSHAAGEQQLSQKSFFQVIQVSDMCGLKGRECVVLSKQ